MTERVKLTKYKAKKLWKKLFRPKCFGERDTLLSCMKIYYMHSTVEERALPCNYFDDCIDEALKEQRQKRNEEKS